MIAERTQTELSHQAAELLAFLQRCGSARHLAKPDRELAQVLGIPVREVIDLADELLTAGHLVIAETSAPMGRWLCTRPQDLTEARRYANSLGRRGIKILRRRKHLRAAMDRAELSRPIDSTGQLRLFDLTSRHAL